MSNFKAKEVEEYVLPRSSHSVSISLLALLPKHETESPLPSFFVSSLGYMAKLPLVFLLVTGFERECSYNFYYKLYMHNHVYSNTDSQKA